MLARFAMTVGVNGGWFNARTTGSNARAEEPHFSETAKAGAPGFVSDVATDLVLHSPAGFAFGFEALALALALTPRVAAVLDLVLESMFVSGFETGVAKDFALGFAVLFSSRSAGGFVTAAD